MRIECAWQGEHIVLFLQISATDKVLPSLAWTMVECARLLPLWISYSTHSTHFFLGLASPSLFFLLWGWAARERTVNGAWAWRFLRIKIPKKESKEDKEADSEALGANKDFKEQLGIMKQLFESFIALEEDGLKKWFLGQPFFSFEYVIQNNLIDFYVVAPRAYTTILEKTNHRVLSWCLFRRGFGLPALWREFKIGHLFCAHGR